MLDLGHRRMRYTAGGLAVVAAITSAAWLSWLSDDAFISFRYAKNLVRGVGLVFNVGERVEGYSHPLWTVWIAAGLKLGASAERWANAWSIAAYGASVALLARDTEQSP